MVKLKKYPSLLHYFVLILTVLFFYGCGQRNLVVHKIEGKRIGVTDVLLKTESIEQYIEPYRKNIDKDLNTVLAYAPSTLDKKGEWQTPLGMLQSTVTLAAASKIFSVREQKKVDICLLNHGGIRSIINKGNITTRTAFELMPFENSLVVVSLRGTEILELVNYLINEKKPHPLAGMTFTIDKNNTAKDIKVQNEVLDVNKIYFVATNDYLYNGGDNMVFFKKGIQTYDLDYKLRNVWIDYFKEVDTIVTPNDVRISKEN